MNHESTLANDTHFVLPLVVSSESQEFLKRVLSNLSCDAVFLGSLPVHSSLIAGHTIEAAV